MNIIKNKQTTFEAENCIYAGSIIRYQINMPFIIKNWTTMKPTLKNLSNHTLKNNKTITIGLCKKNLLSLV
jgi:hypothetical protein